MKKQHEILNQLLQTVYKIRNINNKSNEEEMIEIKNEPYYFEICLLEMKPKNFIINAPFSPREIFQIKNLKEHFTYKGINLEEIITPNIKKIYMVFRKRFKN